jgi:hypothetical protein
LKFEAFLRIEKVSTTFLKAVMSVFEFLIAIDFAELLR